MFRKHKYIDTRGGFGLGVGDSEHLRCRHCWKPLKEKHFIPMFEREAEIVKQNLDNLFEEKNLLRVGWKDNNLFYFQIDGDKQAVRRVKQKISILVKDARV